MAAVILRLSFLHDGGAMSAQSSTVSGAAHFVGNDRLLFGIIFGVLAFWLFAQTTLNISPVMAATWESRRA